MKSTLAKKAITLVKTIYPTVPILDEWAIKVDKTTLYVDIYIPLLKLAVEVHGEQHYKFVPHFHSSIKEFVKQKQRDVAKKLALEEAGIRLVVLPFNEESNWENILRGKNENL
jgi:hypothetical protein